MGGLDGIATAAKLRDLHFDLPSDSLNLVSGANRSFASV
jgi:hypothetical protein